MAEPTTLVGALLALPALLKEIYGDLAKPGVTQVGKALGTVLGLGNTVLWPAAVASGRAEIALTANLDRYRKKLEGVPVDEIVTVTPEIGVPIAERMAYVRDADLANLYVNLLARASTRGGAAAVHPSFANTLDNLCPDEALILRIMKDDIVYAEMQSVQNMHRPGSTYETLMPVLSELDDDSRIANRGQVAVYLGNLQRLGIVETLKDRTLANADDRYRKILAPHEKRLAASLPEGATLLAQRGLIRYTPFGLLFRAACEVDRMDESATDPPAGAGY